MKDNKLYLIHIIECIERIESYTRDGHKAFAASRMKQDAVTRNFEIIGEAVKQIPQAIKEKYPQIQWKRIAGLRDVLIHDYMGVEHEEIWKIVEQDIPALKEKIQSILSDLK